MSSSSQWFVESKSQSRHDLLAAESLADGTCRLLSAKWLRAQSEGLILCRRQDTPEEAFMPCSEARDAFEANDRRVGALS